MEKLFPSSRMRMDCRPPEQLPSEIKSWSKREGTNPINNLIALPQDLDHKEKGKKKENDNVTDHKTEEKPGKRSDYRGKRSKKDCWNFSKRH